jgi:hypothetical protein
MPAALAALIAHPTQLVLPPACRAQTAQYSTQIFSLAVLLSSVFVYNQMGGIDEAALDRCVGWLVRWWELEGHRRCLLGLHIRTQAWHPHLFALLPRIQTPQAEPGNGDDEAHPRARQQQQHRGEPQDMCWHLHSTHVLHSNRC